MKEFIPVKITDKKWADKLMQGEVFMRPLHDFGVWKNHDENKDKSEKAVLNNNYRGDILEGTVSVTDDIEHCEFLYGMDPRVKKFVRQVSFVDNYEAQYLKIYSLYCLKYNPAIDFFDNPDKRMKKFGNTAVIIKDFNSFLRRIAQALVDEYGDDFLFLMDRVKFFSFHETRTTNPIFEKQEEYAYQNELRLAFGELEENKFRIGPVEDGKNMRMIWDLTPKIIQIGDISDIAFEISIDDFLQLNGFLDRKYIWPCGNENSKTIYDLIVEDTRKRIKDFYTPITTPMIQVEDNPEFRQFIASRKNKKEQP